uniref:Uncharacterized protein AlNc14C26G2602 n=1 Tax=Albugo laibachii Nc14 TaxID=890382 RepID=F0W6W6_9STRA|nr:conserved hypothetical protein [Albugo laibachii Nc14]|eukprot:CCA16861.1 conserved hypothetical protein [Albugo laibachii Nc14]
MSSCTYYDFAWEKGPLLLHFTPNEEDLPVICNIDQGENESTSSILPAEACIGDILIAYQSNTTQMSSSISVFRDFKHALQFLQTSSFPVTLRFRSRRNDLPQAILDESLRANIRTNGFVEQLIGYAWEKSHSSLGLSFSYDPCSLHTVIVNIDSAKFSPVNDGNTRPETGDFLVAVLPLDSTNEHGHTIRTDTMQFHGVVSMLRSVSKPCKLMFARLRTNDNTYGDGQEPKEIRSTSPSRLTQHTPRKQGSLGNIRDLRNLKVRARTGTGEQDRPCVSRKPLHALHKRQSFMIKGDSDVSLDKIHSDHEKQTHSNSEKEENKYYEFQFSGGELPFTLDDDISGSHTGSTATDQMYHATIKATHHTSTTATFLEGDVLVGIDRQDLRGLPVQQVVKKLQQIRSPARLVFYRRSKKRNVSITAALADAFMLFLI